MPGKKPIRFEVFQHIASARKGMLAILIVILIALSTFMVIPFAKRSALAESNSRVSFQILTSTPDESGAIYHLVQEGQAAWTIADSYGISIWELADLNNLTAEFIIRPGDLLLIRSPDPPTATPNLLTIQAKEAESQFTATTTPGPLQADGTPVPISETETPVQVTRKMPEYIGGTTAPRSTFLTAFLVIGAALLILVIVIILVNTGRIQ